MAFDTTIRLRQLNQAELSGFVIPLILSYLANTGSFSGVFYPLNSNPSEYLQSGAFISPVDLNSAITQTLAYVSQNFYLNSNPSGFISESGAASSSFIFNCTSGVNGEYISFPTVLPNSPNIACSFVNNLDQNLYYFGLSGVNTSGFYVNYSDTIVNTGYQLSIIMDF